MFHRREHERQRNKPSEALKKRACQCRHGGECLSETSGPQTASEESSFRQTKLQFYVGSERPYEARSDREKKKKILGLGPGQHVRDIQASTVDDVGRRKFSVKVDPKYKLFNRTQVRKRLLQICAI